MQTLEELQAQIAELTRQAEEIKYREKNNIINDMREKIALYGITARDLRLDVGSVPAREGTRSRTGRGKAPPMYRDAYGNTWSGGRGRKPLWVIEVIESGGNIEDYRIKD